MFDIGWSEMLVIVVVAIIVIGPRDLPGVLRTVGKWVAKARSLSREFQRNLNDIARETEFDQVRRSIRETTSLGLASDKPNPVASPTARAGSGPDTGAAKAQATPTGGEKRAEGAAPSPAHEGEGADGVAPQTPAEPPAQAAEATAPSPVRESEVKVAEAADGVTPQTAADSPAQAAEPAARPEG